MLRHERMCASTSFGRLPPKGRPHDAVRGRRVADCEGRCGAAVVAAKSSLANPFADEASAVRVIDGVVDVLLYLHSVGGLRGDVKPTNAVLTDGGAPLLIDFDRRGGERR